MNPAAFDKAGGLYHRLDLDAELVAWAYRHRWAVDEESAAHPSQLERRETSSKGPD